MLRVGEVDVVGGNYKLYILMETQLAQEVVANAAALSSGLASNGHMVVNGISMIPERPRSSRSPPRRCKRSPSCSSRTKS